MDYNNTKYDEFCTERQLKVLNLMRENDGVQARVAEALGVTIPGVSKSLKLVEKKYNMKNVEPHDVDRNGTIAEGFNIHGVSTMTVNSEGKPMWVKTSLTVEKEIKQLNAAREVFMRDVTPIPKADYKLPEQDLDLIPWFNIGDGHLGMIAYDKEVGESFDLKIAERELCAALDVMIDRAPLTDRCVIQDMGDMTHYENIMGKTSESGHDLDFDTRFNKMIETYSSVMQFIVAKALDKYNHVDVIINQGNHSRVNDHWMAVFLRAIYKQEPRIKVLDNSSIFIPYRMGNTFVMSHHFDKCKPAQIAGVMANDFAQDWGESKYHYIDGGHVHSNHQRTEVNGTVTESFNQIAGADKYAHDGGYRSRKCLTTVLRSKTYGETGRMLLTVEEVRDRIMNLEPGTTARKRRDVYTV